MLWDTKDNIETINPYGFPMQHSNKLYLIYLIYFKTYIFHNWGKKGVNMELSSFTRLYIQ